MYGDDEKKPKAIENRHMLFSEAAEAAKRAKAKELWLTHFSPSLSKPEEFLEKANTMNFQELVLEYFPPKKIKKMGIFEKVKRKAKVILMRNKRNY